MFVWFFYQGIYHYQYKIITKSWFASEPEPALPEYKSDENKSKIYLLIFLFFLTKPFLLSY
jgi:hypothetical protein